MVNVVGTKVKNGREVISVGEVEYLPRWDNGIPTLTQLLSPEDERDVLWELDLQAVFELAVKGLEVMDDRDDDHYFAGNALELVDALVRIAWRSLDEEAKAKYE